MTRLQRAAMAAYPPSFQRRYGDELAALVEDLPASASSTADLFLGAARAWVRPPIRSTRQRMQATAATTWIAWCAGFLVGPAINKALMDPPGAGVSAGVRDLLSTAYTLFFVGWALVLIGAAPVVYRSVLPALRAGSRWAVRPLLTTLTLAVIEAAGLLGLAVAHDGGAGNGKSPSTLLAAMTVLWLVGFAAFVASLGLGPAASLVRLEPESRILRTPTLLAVPAAFVLAALTGCSLAATVISGDASLLTSSVPVFVALGVGCAASLAALISGYRGIRALRTT
jgi:MFS family permease